MKKVYKTPSILVINTDAYNMICQSEPSSSSEDNTRNLSDVDKSNVRVCGKCDTINNSNARYCRHCGLLMDNQNSTNNQASEGMSEGTKTFWLVFCWIGLIGAIVLAFLGMWPFGAPGALVFLYGIKYFSK